VEGEAGRSRCFCVVCRRCRKAGQGKEPAAVTGQMGRIEGIYCLHAIERAKRQPRLEKSSQRARDGDSILTDGMLADRAAPARLKLDDRLRPLVAWDG